MIYIEVDNENTVVFTHFLPFSDEYGMGKTEQELTEKGYLVESIPQSETVEGKESITKYDPSTNTFSFVYVDIPPSEIKLLQQENAMLQASVMELSAYAASQDERLQMQENALMELSMLVAGGGA